METTQTIQVAPKNFNSSFDIAEATIKVQTMCSITEDIVFHAHNLFNRFGFLLFDPIFPQQFQDELEAIKKYFGTTIPHKRANSRGVSLIKPIPGFPDYFGTTTIETGLHTDGACSNEPPPKVIILQCVVSEPNGGDSLLLSCKLLYNHILEVMPEQLKELFRPDTFTITRDHQTTKKSVFYYDNGRIHTTFRGDTTANISPAPESLKAFNLVKTFVKDKKNILKFKLRENQILIIDNTSVMHGRLKFSENSSRQLNRVFLDGNPENLGQLYFGFNP